jgi:DNA polymerase-1
VATTATEEGKYKIVFVAESPDRWDNNRGFIGNAASLEKIIEFCKRANIRLDQAYFTYLTRCWTIKKPTLQEQKACIPHTISDIERLQPEVVVLLGGMTSRLFNLQGEGGVTKLRGKYFTVPLPGSESDRTYQVVVTYDPAIFHYRSDAFLEHRILDDYRMIRKLADKMDVSQESKLAKYTLLDTIPMIKDFIEEVKEATFFAFDTESRGLPWSKEPLICISFSLGESRNFVLPMYYHDSDPLPESPWKLKKAFSDRAKKEVITPLLEQIFANKDIHKAAHNIKYDTNVLRKHLGIRVNGFIYDTMLMHHILSEQKPHDLEYLMDIEFGTGNYSDKIEEIVGKGKVLKQMYDEIPDEVMHSYTATDVEGTYKLAKIYAARLREKPHLYNLYWEETAQMSSILADTEWYGHEVDMNVHKELLSSYTEDAKTLLEDIEKTTWKNFNPNSPLDVQKAVIDAGFESVIVNKKNVTGYSTDKEKLMLLKEDLPVADKILKYRNTQKMLGTYLENVVKDREADNRIRYGFLIHGTESGRLSNRFFHQLPRVDKQRKVNMRDMLIAGPESTLVYFDYDQIEMRVLTELSGDKELSTIFCYPEPEVLDVHTATAGTVLGIPYAKVNPFNRQNTGKMTNFGLAYGSEGHALVKKGLWEDEKGVRHPITWDMMNEGMARFREKYVSLALFLEMQPNIARRAGGILTTPFGRERRMGGKLVDAMEGVRKAAEREVGNFIIQSTAVAITFRSLILLAGILRDWVTQGLMAEGDIRLVNTVHDSGTYEVSLKDGGRLLTAWTDTLKKVLVRPIPELGDRQFPCSIGVGACATIAESNKIAQ